MGRRLGDDADFEDKGAEEGGAHSSTNGRLASALRDAISEAPIGAQVEMTVPKMKDLLERSGLGPAAVARLDSHIRKGSPLHDDWHKGDRMVPLTSLTTKHVFKLACPCSLCWHKNTRGISPSALIFLFYFPMISMYHHSFRRVPLCPKARAAHGW